MNLKPNDDCLKSYLIQIKHSYKLFFASFLFNGLKYCRILCIIFNPIELKCHVNSSCSRLLHPILNKKEPMLVL